MITGITFYSDTFLKKIRESTKGVENGFLKVYMYLIWHLHGNKNSITIEQCAIYVESTDLVLNSPVFS